VDEYDFSFLNGEEGNKMNEKSCEYLPFSPM
jgi:hypothetical protein